tara:strand:+ start:1903 stop:2424 length:522 start_codon:yes stop_codon:yes gene_type:complete
MPKGVYRKKDKKGRWMHFRDGKIISKKSYLASKSRTGTKKGQVRKTARRAYKKKRGNPSNSKRRNNMKSIPHPSITGMASGLAIAAYLNSGVVTGTRAHGSQVIRADGVIKDVTDGQLGAAFGTLATNAVNMISSDTGRKVLVGSSLIALAGAFARSRFPQLKLGGSKLYFRI